MHEVLEIIAIDLKSQILEGFKCQDPVVYSKIVAFQEAFKISEATGNRYSISLLLDLFFSFEHGLVNPNAVLHEINYLEGKEKKSGAKEASMFKKHQAITKRRLFAALCFVLRVVVLFASFQFKHPQRI